MIRSIATSIALASLATGAYAQKHAPKVLIDEGACPFECCQYGRWTATENTHAFVSPSAKHAVLTIPTGTAITALTGYVRTVGQPFLVTRSHAPYKPGDTYGVHLLRGRYVFGLVQRQEIHRRPWVQPIRRHRRDTVH
jgi:hypothetical protein